MNPKLRPGPDAGGAKLAPRAQTLAARRHSGLLSEKRLERFWGYLFVLPTLVLLAVFSVYPALIAGYYSLTRFDFISPPRFVGLENFRRAFSDPDFGTAVLNTLYMCVGVPIGMALALFLGVLLTNPKLRFAALYRSIYFLPVILPLVAMGTIWVRLLSGDDGWLNRLLGSVGLSAVPWLSDYGWSKVTITAVGIWSGFGGSLVVLMGGLGNVPSSLYEAARLDGATPWAQFRHITLPLLVPTLTLVGVASFIGALQIFDLVVVLTNGGPGTSSTSIAFFIYQVAFKNFQMGYAACLSVLLFALMFLLSVGQFKLGERLRHDV